MSTVPVGNNVNPLSWLSVLNEVNGTTNAAEAQQVSETNRSVTFTATVNGVVTTVTMNVPDDLELPAEVTPDAIDNLMATLVEGDFNLTQTQLLAIKASITKTYNQMASALAAVQSNSTGRVMFDLYQLMALLVEVAQSQRDAARDLRNTQNQQIQNSIQAQADSQRDAAIVGLVVGVTCGVISAAVSVGMLAGQAVSYKGQINAARSSGVEATQNQVTMLQNADTPEHAQAQLAKVEAGIKTEGLASGVKNTITGNTADAKAKFLAAKNIEQKQANVNDASAQLTEAKQVESQAADVVKTKEAELATATGELNKEAKTEELLGVEIPPVKIEGDKITGISYTGSGKTIHLIKDVLFNQAMVRVAVSLTGSIGGQINPMLLMALNDDDKKDSLLPLLLMNQQGGAVGMNPMLMLALAGKEDGKSSLKDLLMMSALTGNNLFGGAAFGVQAPAQVVDAPAETETPAAE